MSLKAFDTSMENPVLMAISYVGTDGRSAIGTSHTLRNTQSKRALSLYNKRPERSSIHDHVEVDGHGTNVLAADGKLSDAHG